MERREEDQLRQYTLYKQGVAEILRQIKLACHDLNLGDTEEAVQSLLVKLAEDRFNLAVVGQFKRGKSTLMNAIIGRDLLPTGLLPLTSAITTLCYGSPEGVYLKRKNWSLEQDISMSDLAEYVTERGNPGNEKGIIEARIELANSFLRRGLYFIDTPGIGSSQLQNTITTYEFLPEADAVIFVTSVDAPLSQVEEDFLEKIRLHVRKLFVVVNKIDLVDPEEQRNVLDYISAKIQKVLDSPVRLYPLSARLALKEKINSESPSQIETGLTAFEEALASYLNLEKSTTFLVSLVDRADRILSEITAQAQEDFISNPFWREAVNQLAELRSNIVSQEPIEPEHTLPASTAPSVSILNTIMQNSQAAPKKLVEALKSKTCPICEAQSQAVFDFLTKVQNQLVKEKRARYEFAETQGLCPVHTWQFAPLASAQVLSEAYPILLDQKIKQLRNVDERTNPITYSCPACQVVQSAGETALSKFLSEISTPEGRQTNEQTLLCMSHLTSALREVHPEVAEYLTQMQIRIMEATSEDMRSYALKRDAVRRGLITEDEQKSWRRALVQLYGEPSAYSNGDRTLRSISLSKKGNNQ